MDFEEMGRSACYAILTLCLCASPLSSAQEYSLTMEQGVASKYVFRGIELGDDTLHPAVEFSQGDFYAGAWGALPLGNKGWPEGFVDEYDFYAGYGWALDERTALDVGGTYYRYPGENGDSFEGFVGVKREMGTFTPSLYLYRDFDLDTLTVELSTDLALPLDVLPFETSFFVGRVEARRSGDYSYFGADFVYPIEFNDSTKLSFGLHYSDHDLGRGIPGNHLYGSASLAVRF